MDHDLAGRRRYDRRVVRLAQADHDLLALHGRKVAESAFQDVRADLSAATAATHGVVGDSVESVGSVDFRREAGLFLERRIVVFGHETPVDPVFPLPYGRPSERQRSVGRDRAFFADGDQAQEIRLRPVPPQAPAEQPEPQVVGERFPLPHREHSGLGARVIVHGRYVARCEYVRVRNRLQRILDPDEASPVDRKPRLRRPFRRAGAGRPKDLVGFELRAGRVAQPAGRNFDDRMAQMDRDAASAQEVAKGPAHRCAVGGQELVGIAE